MKNEITIDLLSSTIEEMLTDYSAEVKKTVAEVLPKVARDTVKELKKTSPKKTGDYASGWKSKKETSRIGTKVTIYNDAKPYLTHLLENGHANRDGGRTSGIPHIKPAEQNAIKETIKQIEDSLEK